MDFVASLTTRASAALDAAKARAEAVRSSSLELAGRAAQTVQARVQEARARGAQAAGELSGRVLAAVASVKSLPGQAGERAQQARASLVDAVAFAKAGALQVREEVREKGLKTWAQDTAISAKGTAALKAQEVYAATGEVVSQKSFQATTASAAAGGVALGVGGGAVGTIAGGLSGAAAGLPLALFTFGLSIPVGAVVGGGAGLVLGSAAGATAGAVGGGALGYGTYQKGDDIRSAGRSVVAKATSGAEAVKGQAYTTLKSAKEQVAAARLRLVGGQSCTGGTVDAKN